MQECYKVLGVSENATMEEIDAQYLSLKNQYSKDRFLEGEKGNDAAKNLTKLESAYEEIKELRAEKTDKNGSSEIFKEVEKLIKEGDLSTAQERLDDVSERNGEWHYLQSVIFYKKSWISESKKQLEIAMSIEPNNKKYSDTYKKLEEKIKFNESQFRSGNTRNADDNGERVSNRQMGGEGLNDCCSFCTTWCCMNMLCNMCCH